MLSRHKANTLALLISKVKISEGVGWEVLLLMVTDTVIENMLYIFNTKKCLILLIFLNEKIQMILTWQNLKA